MNTTLKAVAVIATVTTIVGCVSVESTRSQLASGDKSEVAKAENNIYAIATTGKDASGMMSVDVLQQIEYVRLVSNPELLMRIVSNASDPAVINAAIERIDFSKAGVGIRFLKTCAGKLSRGGRSRGGSLNNAVIDSVSGKIVSAMTEAELCDTIAEDAYYQCHDAALARVVEVSNDQKLLGGFAKTGQIGSARITDDEVRNACRAKAIRKIDSGEVLMEIAVGPLVRDPSPKAAFDRLVEIKDGKHLTDLFCRNQAKQFFTERGKEAGDFQSDLSEPEVTSIARSVTSDEDMERLAKESVSFRLRMRALGKLKNQNVISEIAIKVNSCPYDITEKTSGIFGMSERMEAIRNYSAYNLREMAVSRLTDVGLLKKVRREITSESLKKLVIKRLLDLGANDVEDIVSASRYSEDLLQTIGRLENMEDCRRVAKDSKLKGVKILAAMKLPAQEFQSIVSKEVESVSDVRLEGAIVVGGMSLGMNIEDVFARLVSQCPKSGYGLYMAENGSLVVRGKDGRDVVRCKGKSQGVSLLTIPVELVTRFVGVKCKTYDDLEKAIEKKLGVDFKYSTVRKGDVFQRIGFCETVSGETVRFYRRGIGEDESIALSVKESHLKGKAAIAGAFGVSDSNGDMLADAINLGLEKAAKDQENKRFAALPCFAVQGSLQLFRTEDIER